MEEHFRKDYKQIQIEEVTYYYDTITFPESYQAIYGCEGGEVAKFPAMIENLPVMTLCSNESFLGQGFTCKKAIVAEGIKTITQQSFYNNSYIEELILPESLEILGWQSFACCSRLKSVSMSQKHLIKFVTAFKGSAQLQQIKIYDNAKIYTGHELMSMIAYFYMILTKDRHQITLDKDETQLLSMCREYGWDNYIADYHQEYNELFGRIS